MLQQMRSAAKWIWIFIVIAFVGGFLFASTSGLLGRDRVTTSSVVATVNGTDIPYLTWVNVSNSLAQQREQQMGRGLNGDERRAVEDQGGQLRFERGEHGLRFMIELSARASS